MMKSPKFTAVVPLFNKVSAISSTLDSIFSQTYDNFELIVVNDGSTDGSAEIVANLKHRSLRLVNQPNMGVSSARNTGIRLARAPYVAFLDADDLWMPDYLEILAKLIDDFPGAGIYATSYLLSDGGGALREPKIAREAAAMKPGPMPNYFQVATIGDTPFLTISCCADRSILQSLGGFKPELRYGEDTDMWGRIALSNSIVYSPAQKSIYRLEAENRASRRIPDLIPCAFREDAELAIDLGAVDPAHIDSIREYLTRIDLYNVRSNLTNPDRRSLRKFIDNLHTTTLTRRKMIYRSCSYLPGPLIGGAISLHGFIKQKAPWLLSWILRELF